MKTSAAATPAVTHPRLHSPRLLRLALKLDAAITGANGAAYVLAAPLLQDVLGLPAGALRGIGSFLLVFAATVWFLATRSTISAGAAGAVVALNLLWAVDSVAMAVAGWGSPTTVGTAWVLLQAAVVGGFGSLQWVGIRRGSRGLGHRRG